MMLEQMLLRRCFATKGARVTAQKQQLRRRQKAALIRATTNTASANQREALTSALFSVTNPRVPPTDTSSLRERATIARVWSQVQMARIHARSTWERNYLLAKLEAMEELRKVSGQLAVSAERIDYSIPPLHRRLPTETPPDAAKFPFRMSINHEAEGSDGGKGNDRESKVNIIT